MENYGFHNSVLLFYETKDTVLLVFMYRAFSKMLHFIMTHYATSQKTFNNY